MKRQKHVVKLTKTQRKELEKLVRSTSKKVTAQSKNRAKALLFLDENSRNPLTPDKTAKKCKLHRESVYNIRMLFATEGVERAVYRKSRKTPPVEPKVTGEVEAHIIATACSTAPEGKTRWTLQMIADKVVLDGVLDGLSKDTVRRTLKKRNLSLI